MSDNTDCFAFGTKANDIAFPRAFGEVVADTQLTLLVRKEAEVVLISINDGVATTPVVRQLAATLDAVHHSHIEAVLQYDITEVLRLLRSAERIDEVVVARKFTTHIHPHPVRVFRVVVELRVRMPMHQHFHIAVPDVARAVQANARTELTLEPRLLTMRKVLVVGNLSVHLCVELLRVIEHPLRLADARLLDVLKHASHTSGVETEQSAFSGAVCADINSRQ